MVSITGTIFKISKMNTIILNVDLLISLISKLTLINKFFDSENLPE